MEEFESRYGRLLEQIDELPETGRETDRNFRKKLREITVSLNGIEGQLKQMSVAYSNKENLKELEKQLNKERLSLMDIWVNFKVPWERLRTHGSGFFEDFRKALIEANGLVELLKKTMKELRKS